MFYIIFIIFFAFTMVSYCLCVTAKRADEELEELMRIRVQNLNKNH